MTVLHHNDDYPETIDPALEKARSATELMAQAGFEAADMKQTTLLGARVLDGYRVVEPDAFNARLSDSLAREAEAAGRINDAEILYLNALRADPELRASATILSVAALHIEANEIDRGSRQLTRAADHAAVRAPAAAQLAVMTNDGNHRKDAFALLQFAMTGMPASFARELKAISEMPVRRIIRHSKEEVDGNKLFIAAARFHVEGKFREAYYFYMGASERGFPLAKLGVISCSRWVLPGQPCELKAYSRAKRSELAAAWLAEQRDKLVERVRREPDVLAIEPKAARDDPSEMDRLVDAAIDGNRSAMNRVLAIIRPLVVRYCRARLGRVERGLVSADDVAQEVCLAVLTALPAYRDQGRPFLAFVYGIAAHKVVDAHRSAARSRADAVSELPDLPSPTIGPEQHVLNGALSVQMGTILDQLPAKQREILVLRVVVGLSAEETAEATGTTAGGVRVAQHRALSKLRSTVAAPGDDELIG